MNILIVEPGKHPRLADIEHTLESMHNVVGGYIEAIYPWEDPVAIVCDEEAKLKSDTEWNRMLPETQDVIKGTFFICGIDEDNFSDITPELAEKFKQRFWNIELFIPTPNGLMPIVIKD